MKRNYALSCSRLGQEGLSLVIVGVLLVLSLQKLDELVEARGDGCTWCGKVSAVAFWQGKLTGSGEKTDQAKVQPSKSSE